VGTVHCTVTHGCGVPDGSVNTHPATVNWSVTSATGVPLACTRVLALITVTWPPCGQVAPAPTWKSGAGMSAAPAGRPRMPGPGHVITRAPALTVTVGPTSVITAPLPLEMTMPVSLTTMLAPLALLRMMPPAPGTSLMTMPFCSVV